MNWQAVVILLRNVFAYSDIHVVEHTFESYGVHALSSEGDPNFYVEDEVEQYSKEIHPHEKNLETDLGEIRNLANLLAMDSSLFSREK